jgi:hypothetical protein
MGRDRVEQQRRGGGSVPTQSGGGNLPGFGRGAATTASYGKCPHIGRALDAAIAAGDAISFGRTSDETALVVTVLRNRTQEKAYPHTQAQLDELMHGLAEHYASARAAAQGAAGV